MLTVEEILRWYQKQKLRKTLFETMYEDCYRFAIPNREYSEFYASEGKQVDPDLYDSTAVDSLTRFANRVHGAMTPNFLPWLNLGPGYEVPAELRGQAQTLLNVVGARFFDLLGNTSFSTEMNESYYDFGVGMAGMTVMDFDSNEPAVFKSVPAPNMVVADGITGGIDHVWWHDKYSIDQITKMWPDARLPPAWTRDPKTDRFTEKVIMSYVGINDNGGYDYAVMAPQEKFLIFSVEDMDDSPIIVEAWARVSGEQYGRGPVTNALPDIRTANETVRMTLENASLSIAGVYTAVDDGVLNPTMVEIAPGMVIPVASNGGTLGRSLDVLQRAGDFDVGQLVLSNLQAAIRRKLFDETTAPLNETVRSAEEVRLRQKMLAEEIGPAYGRVQRYILKIVNRTFTIFSRRGLLPPMKIDNRNIKAEFLVPSVRSRQEGELDDLSAAAQRIEAIWPGFGQFVFRPETVVPYIAERYHIPANLMAPPKKLIEIQQQMGQMAASQVQNAGQ